VSELEAEFRTKGGDTRIGVMSGDWIEGAGVPQVLTVVRDVTESRRADLAVRESRARLLQAQRVARVGFLDWDLRTNQIFLSDEVCELTGFRPEGGITTPEFMNRSVHPDDLAYAGENLQLAIQGVKPYDVVHRHLRPDGGIVWVHAQAELTRDADGTPTRLLGTIADVTDLKKTEEALRTLNAELEARVAARTTELEARNRELETFTYSVSHDLKAPLRGLDGYSRLLLEDHADRLDAEGRSFLQSIRRAALNMGQLIDDLLAYSKLERRTMQSAPVDLRALVETLVQERAEEAAEHGATVSVDVPPGTVTADRDGLAQAVRNLLDNALKFTGGAAQPAVAVGGHETPTAVVLWVKDNGVGFEMRFHDRIFDIFQRLHRQEDYPGTGIGLAIVKKALERMGGRVWAESTPGHGATFWLEIPK
jgi:PAS domain S-box-containing protein